MWRVGLAGVAASLLASAPALAQTGSITGRVLTADDSRPIAAAQIQVRGAGGAITGDDGRYSVRVEPGTYTVRVSRIGFSPDSVTGVVVTAGGTTTADFQLRISTTVLEGLVVTGYGTREARDITGGVATVSTEEFNVGRVISPEQLIAAKVPGVQVIDTGEPGGGISVRIRGGTSVNASNEPLIVVDGVPLPNGGGVTVGRNALSFLNPQDIENVTVLKDASAAAIYGASGANGVIIITTKSGTRTGSQVEYSTSYSSSQITREAQMLNATQFRSLVEEYAPHRAATLGTANTNWRDLVQRSAGGIEHHISVSNARDDMTYRLALGYLDQDGVLVGTGARRLTASAAYSDRFFDDRLSVRGNVRGSRGDDRFTPGGALGSALEFGPTQPIRLESGAFYEYEWILAPTNPMSQLSLISDRGVTYRSVGNLMGEYQVPFLEGLKATLNLGYDVAKAERTQFEPSTLKSQSVTGGTFFRNSPSQTNTLLDLYGTYTRQLLQLESEIDFTAGYSYGYSAGDYPRFRAQGLTSDLLGPSGIPTATLQQNFLDVDESKLVSFFGRVNYTLRDRYLFALSVRRDGSSKFGPDNQWGTFPAAAVGWRVIDEPFMNSDLFSDLKLRVSWGVTGNQSIGNYLAFPTYLIGDAQSQVQFGDEFVATIRPSAVDPNIKWEETTSYNIGLDFGILRNRISGALDYYQKRTEDLIFTVNIPAGTNLSNRVTTNIGTMENRGFELSLNAAIMEGTGRSLSWLASFNAATNDNKLVRVNPYGGGERIEVGGIAGGVGSNIQVITPGHPVNSFFVYRHKRDANGRPINTGSDLDMYEDLDGDGAIGFGDRRPYKSPQPKWMLGHTSLFRYGSFDGSFTLQAHLGNHVYNNVASNYGHLSALSDDAPRNRHVSVLEYGFDDPQYFSEVYVEDASFLRMDNVTVGYTFRNMPAARQMRVFGTIQNAFITTRYSGVDPLAGVNGIDFNVYPRSRTFTIGLSAGF